MTNLDDSTDEIFNQDYDKTVENNYNYSKLPSVKNYNLLKEVISSHIHKLNTSKSEFDMEFTWERAMQNEVISIKNEHFENNIGVFNVVTQSNKGIFSNKIIQVFSILHIEILNILGQENSEESKNSLLFINLYGEILDESTSSNYNKNESRSEIDNNSNEEGASEISISRIIPKLIELYEKIKKLIPIAVNLNNQLLSLYNKSFKGYKDVYKRIYLHKPLEFLSRILGFFHYIDVSVTSNKSLLKDWNQYKLMYHKTKEDSIEYGYTSDQSLRLEKYIRIFENSIFSGNLLRSLFTHIYTSSAFQEYNTEPILCKEYCEYLGSYIKSKGESLISNLNSIYETDNKERLFDLITLLGYYDFIFEKEDEKNQNKATSDKECYKVMLSLLKKLYFIPLYPYNINFRVDDYYKSLYKLKKKVDSKEVKELINVQIESFSSGYENLIYNLRLQVVSWVSKTNSNIFDKENNEKESKQGNSQSSTLSSSSNKVNMKLRLITNGILLMYQLKNNLILLLNSFLINEKTFKGNIINSISLSLELIKVVQLQLKRQYHEISLSYNMIIKYIHHELRVILIDVEKKLKQSKEEIAYSKEIAYVLNLLSTNLLSGSSELRNAVNELCFNFIKNKQIMSQTQLEDVSLLLWKLKLIRLLSNEIFQSSDCSFIYFFKDLYEAFFKVITSSSVGSSIDRIYFLSFAISDTERILGYIEHLSIEEKEMFVNEYKSNTKKELIDTVFLKYAKDLESNLKYHIHSILIDELKGPDEVDKQIFSSIDFNQIVSLRNIKLFNNILSLKYYIQDFLNRSFYNLTTINISDYKTYQQIRILAYTKYSLHLHDVFLPSQTLDQGMDCLYILRNLSNFVSSYYYNLHSQLFIEITKEGSNYITMIGIPQILNSLNTHGIGIINSIVNKVYHFLINRLKSISNIINDEYIKSALIAEKSFWNDNKDKYNNKFPYKRAMILMKDIKEYIKKGDLTIIDQMRSYISQIGNALGFVRSLKSALTEYRNQSIKYFSSNPSLLVDYLSKLKINSNMSSLINKSKDILDETLTLLQSKRGNKMYNTTINSNTESPSNEEEVKTNYLLVLLESFEDIFTTKNIPDIDILFYIFPSLMISYIENLIVSKERLFKKNTNEAKIGDDGFVVGIVFLLKVLKQETCFDELHWFDSAIYFFCEEEKEFKNEKKGNVNQTVQKGMTLKKTEVYKKEFELLNFMFDTAMILFNKY